MGAAYKGHMMSLLPLYPYLERGLSYLYYTTVHKEKEKFMKAFSIPREHQHGLDAQHLQHEFLMLKLVRYTAILRV